MGREGIICFFLMLATLVVFAQVRHHDFVHLDDDLYITDNPNYPQAQRNLDIALRQVEKGKTAGTKIGRSDSAGF
jgi:hypothetical protein